MDSSPLSPTQNPWGSLVTFYCSSLASCWALGTGSSDVQWVSSSGGLGQLSLLSKEAISQSSATQGLKLGLVKTLLGLCSLANNKPRVFWTGQETIKKNTFSSDGIACM